MKFGWKTGLEPATFGTTIRRSNQLSYNHHFLWMQRYTFFLIQRNSRHIFLNKVWDCRKNRIFEFNFQKTTNEVTQKVKLTILGISFSQVQAGAYALIFAEESGARRLPIIIGTPEAQSIAVVMEKITPPRPMSHDLMVNMFDIFKVELKEVFIHKFEEGAFFSELTLKMGKKEYKMDSRTSDAVALAIRLNTPIYTTEKIMQTMAIVFDEREVIKKENISSSETVLPSDLSQVHLEALKTRLQEAVSAEDYELATRLRDEINTRENKS